MKNRNNKTIAGYHLLMILSAVDRRFGMEEDLVIKEYLQKEFPFDVNLDKQMEIISGLEYDDYEPHFMRMMDDFYSDATEAERNNMLDFAIKLVKADNIITKEENKYLQILFDTWNPEHK
jgi:hypothetical protein